MIDIHHHCLPGVDDGPRDWSSAVDLCRMAADEGIETVVATPHVLRGRWQNTSRAELDSLILKLRDKVGSTPRLLLGSEYFFSHDIDDVLRRGNAIVPLAGGRYILIEFASHTIPPLVAQPLHRAQLDGWQPVIAHPERNAVLQSRPDLLVSLLRSGVRSQITAGSITGLFGPEAQSAALAWLRAGYVHAIATDAHSCAKRPPRFRQAWQRVVDLCGESVARALFVTNPQAIIEGRSLIYDPDINLDRQKEGLLARVKRYFGQENRER